MDVEHGEVVTGDGVRLHYLEAGAGDPVVIVPGFACTAEGWRAQVESLSVDHRVIAVDMRGHGRSDRPGHGYRVSRLAADVRDVLDALDLNGATLMGHSMGCVVCWSFLDLFDSGRVTRLVLVDQAAVLMRNPVWTDDELRRFGGFLDADQVVDFANRLADDSAGAIGELFGAMPTDAFPPDRLDALLREARTLPGRHGAGLFLDVATADLRDVLARIGKPTLYIGGRHRTVSRTAQEWICDQIPDCRHAMFEADDGGSHFMYLENPERFTAVVADFLATTAP